MFQWETDVIDNELLKDMTVFHWRSLAIDSAALIVLTALDKLKIVFHWSADATLIAALMVLTVDESDINVFQCCIEV